MTKIFPAAFLLCHQLKPSVPTSHVGWHVVDGSLLLRQMLC